MVVAVFANRELLLVAPGKCGREMATVVDGFLSEGLSKLLLTEVDFGFMRRELGGCICEMTPEVFWGEEGEGGDNKFQCKIFGGLMYVLLLKGPLLLALKEVETA